MRFVSWCTIVVAVVAFTMRARAQPAAEVTAHLSTDVVEVGEPFTVELVAMAESDAAIDSPTLRVPGGFQAAGPRVSTRTTAHFGGGQSVVKNGIGATWQLVASQEGTFTIPPPTVNVAGQPVTAHGSLRVRVVAVGSKPRRAPPSSPFGGLFNFPFPTAPNDLFDDEREREEDMSPKARELALKREPDPYVFVRIATDKQRCVVGEQITLSYYVYYRTDLQLTVQREPPLGDFLRMEIDRTSGTEDAILTSVGGFRYHVKLLDQVAIFPVRAGKLSTGALSARFTGRRFGSQELERASNEVEIDVREPPLEGRPLGYRLGDVGSFTLTAKVSPRQTTAGETVAVEVRLAGRGNLPAALKIPERTGVEWLTPEKNEEIGLKSGKISGWRSFGYAVRLGDAGEIDLGTLALPYYDDETRRYEVAQVELGTVQVSPRAGDSKAGAGGGDPRQPSERDAFGTLATPRTERSPFTPAADSGVDPRLFWSFLVAPPVLVVVTTAFWAAMGKLRRRRQAKKRDPATLARRALSELRTTDDPKDRAAHAERAIHLAVEASTGVKSRGVLLADLALELGRHEVATHLIDDVVDTLQACSTVRFDPSPAPEAAETTVTRARPLVTALLKSSRAATAGVQDEAR